MMEEVLGEEPDYYWGWQRLADWYESSDQPEKFLEASEQLVRLAPRDAMAYEYRGEARRATALQCPNGHDLAFDTKELADFYAVKLAKTWIDDRDRG